VVAALSIELERDGLLGAALDPGGLVVVTAFLLSFLFIRTSVRRMRVDDSFRIGSSTNTFTATALALGTHGYVSEGCNEFQGKVAPDIAAAVTSFKDVTDNSASVDGAGNGVSMLGDLAKCAAADFGNVLLPPQDAGRTRHSTPGRGVQPG
jgi:hypothetical protein